MYLPRRSTAAMRSPSRTPATSVGSSGRVRRASSMRAEAIRFPTAAAARRPRSVSTSGSSGTDRFEHDRHGPRRLAAQLVRVVHGGCRLLGRHLVAGVDLGEHLALLDGVSALLPAHDADRMVDGIVLRPPPGAEMHG